MKTISYYSRAFLTQFGNPLRRNSTILIANSAIGVVFGLVFWVIVARFYSTSDVGLAAALVSASGLLSLLSLLGFDLSLIRFLPAAKNRVGIIKTCLTMAGVVSILISLVYIAGVSLWTPRLDSLKALWPAILFIVATVTSTISLLQEKVFIEKRRPEHASVQSLTASVIRIPLALMLTSFGTWGIWVSWSISVCFGAVVGNIILMKTEPGYYPVPQINLKIIRGMGSFSFGSYIANFASSIPIYVFPLLLVAVLGATASAYYYIGYRIGATLYAIPWLISMAFFVEGSHNPGQLHSLFVKALRFSLFTTTLGLIFFLVSGPWILKIFGKEYSESSKWILWLVSLSALPSALNEMYVAAKRVQLKVRVTAYFSILLAIAILGFSYALMLLMGLVGVGLGWVLGQLTGAIVVLVWLRWRFQERGMVGK